MLNPKSVYIAGPEIFLPHQREVGEAKKRLCREHGFEPLYPMDPPVTLDAEDPRENGLRIFRSDIALMQRADFCIANITPFRGVSLDPGTAFEIGWMHGVGKPIFGYTNVADDLTARVAALYGGRLAKRADGALADPDGLMIEGFAMHDNLMIDGAVIESGFPVVVSPAPTGKELEHLEGFEACLRQARGLILGR